MPSRIVRIYEGSFPASRNASRMCRKRHRRVPSYSDEVINWNVIATSVALPGGQNAIQQSRTYAMVQLRRSRCPERHRPTICPVRVLSSRRPDGIGAGRHRYCRARCAREPGASASRNIDAALTTSLGLIAPGALKGCRSGDRARVRGRDTRPARD